MHSLYVDKEKLIFISYNDSLSLIGTLQSTLSYLIHPIKLTQIISISTLHRIMIKEHKKHITS